LSTREQLLHPIPLLIVCEVRAVAGHSQAGMADPRQHEIETRLLHRLVSVV